LAAGYFAGTLLYYLFALLRLPWMYFLVLAGMDAWGIKLVLRKKMVLPRVSFTLPGLAFLVFFLVFTVQVGVHCQMTYSEESYPSLYPDAWWMFPYAADVKNLSLPPDNPFTPGSRYTHHFFHEIFPALTSRWMGVPLINAHSLTNGLVLFLALPLVYFLGTRLFRSRWAGLFSALTVFLGADGGLAVALLDSLLQTGSISHGNLKDIYPAFFSAPSIAALHSLAVYVGILGVAAGLLFLMRFLEHGKWGDAVFFAAALAVTLRAKTPFADAFFAAMGVTALLAVFLYRRMRLGYAYLVLLGVSFPLLLELFGVIGGIAGPHVQWSPFYYATAKSAPFIRQAYPAVAKWFYGADLESHRVWYGFLFLAGSVWPYWFTVFALPGIWRRFAPDATRGQMLLILALGAGIGYYVYFFYIQQGQIDDVNVAWFSQFAALCLAIFTGGLLWRAVEWLAGPATPPKKIAAGLLWLYFLTAFYWNSQLLFGYGKAFRIWHSPATIKDGHFIRDHTPRNARMLMDGDVMPKVSLFERPYPHTPLNPTASPEPAGVFGASDPALVEKIIDNYRITYIFKENPATPLLVKETPRYRLVLEYEQDGRQLYEVVPKDGQPTLPEVAAAPTPVPAVLAPAGANPFQPPVSPALQRSRALPQKVPAPSPLTPLVK